MPPCNLDDAILELATKMRVLYLWSYAPNIPINFVVNLDAESKLETGGRKGSPRHAEIGAWLQL